MFPKWFSHVFLVAVLLGMFTGVAFAYTGTLTAIPSATTVKAGESFDVVVKATPTTAGDCIGAGGMYFQAPGTLTAANITAAITFHNAAQFSALNSTTLQVNGVGSPPIYGDFAKVTAGTQLNGGVTYELFTLNLIITEAGSFTFNATNGPGVGQDTLISCNGQDYGQTTTGFSITVAHSIISGKVTQNDGVTGIAGASVKLVKDAITIGPVLSAADGSYSLTTTRPGTYSVQVTPPSASPSWSATTPATVNATVPGNQTVNFKFISTSNVSATILTTIPGGYSLQGRTASWVLGSPSDSGSSTIGVGGSFVAPTVDNFPGPFVISVRGFNDFLAGFTPNAAGVNLGSGTICVDTDNLGDLGHGQTGAEDLTWIATHQGASASDFPEADNSGDGVVTARDYTAALGSAGSGCNSNVIPSLARSANVSAGVAMFGLGLSMVGAGYEFVLTGKSPDPVSGVLVVVEKDQWNVSTYTPAELEGFDLNGSWDNDGKLMFYYERERAEDGSIPQLPLEQVTFGTGQMQTCSAGQMVAGEYPYSHMAIPRHRLSTQYVGDWGTCPGGSIFRLLLPAVAR